MIRVCVIGLGKTGKEITKVISKRKDMKIVSAVCSPGSKKEGMDLGDIVGMKKTNVIVRSSNEISDILEDSKPDVAIDFSSAKATLENSKALARAGVNLLVGTTGFSQSEINKLMLLAQKYDTGILYAPNITTGVNVLMMLANLASSFLNDYDVQITEIHHRNKKDIPSGTALKIAEEVEKGLSSAGVELSAKEIPINAVRAGGVIGKHEVVFVSEYDEILISHQSFSRRAFALGAIKGIRFLVGKSGFFEMSDVIDFRKILINYINATSNVDESIYA